MATTTPSAKTLDSAQRAWLKKMGAALDVRLGGVALKTPSAAPGASAPDLKSTAAPAAPPDPKKQDAKKDVTAAQAAAPSKDSTAAAGPKISVAGKPLLIKGAKGNDVKDLQTLLNKHGATLNVDGDFGKLTEEAVREFQKKNPPLAVDGKVGEKTWTALGKDPETPPAPPDTKPRRVVVIVTDSATNNAVDKAEVTIADQSENTGNTGQATLSLAPGKHPFGVSAPGFKQGVGTVDVTTQEETQLRVELERKAPQSITIKPQNPPPLAPQGTQQFTATDDSGADVTSLVLWSSSDENIVSIDARGLATAEDVSGTATITASVAPPVGGASKNLIGAPAPAGASTDVTLTVASTTPDPNKLKALKKPTKPDTKPRKVTIKAIDDDAKEIPSVSLKVTGVRQSTDSDDEDMLDLSAKTNAKGTAGFFLPPRTYRIEGTAPGFNKSSGSFPITVKPGKPLELKMKKTAVPVTSIELTVSPPRATQSIQAIDLAAKVSLRDTTKVPVGHVLFEDLKSAQILARKDLLKNAANFKLSSASKGKHTYRATFKPTPPVAGVEECQMSVEHVVFDRIKELEFLSFRNDLEPEVGDCLVSARKFESLKAERLALAKGWVEVLKLANASEFEKALERAKLLEPDVNSYLVKAVKENEKFVKAGEAFDKRLNDAKDKAAEAMKIAKELKKEADVLEHLPLAPRNRLLAALQKPPFNDEKKKAARILLSVEYMDPVFERRNQEHTLKLAKELKGDQEFKEARESWQQDSFTTEKRLKILQKAVDAHAVAFDIKRFAPEPDKYEAPRVVPMQKSLPYPDKTTTVGEYDHKNKQLEMNVHDTALKQQPFEEALDTVIHEMAHHQQSMMTDRLKKPPKMSESDPDFLQAQSFKLNDTSGGFYVHPLEPPPSAGKGEEYFTQPDENHSRVTAALIAAAGIGK